MAEGTRGPRPDGQVRELIEVMLGTATRIGEALALRRRDEDMAADPPRVHICGTVIVGTGKGVSRQEHPKTHESNRVVAVPAFAAEVIRHRLTLIPGEDAEPLLFFSRNRTALAPYNVRRVSARSSSSPASRAWRSPRTPSAAPGQPCSLVSNAEPRPTT
jgi:integrase